MPDRPKVLAGLAVFAILATLPIWYGFVFGGAVPRPVLAKPSGAACVEPLATMRTQHMTLLNSWRDQVVRQGNTVYVASTGASHRIRLTGTCLGCHGEMAGFCGRCHDYAGVRPNCWDCHHEKPPPVPEVR